MQFSLLKRDAAGEANVLWVQLGFVKFLLAGENVAVGCNLAKF
jgi:hypothetical protein